MNKTKLTAIVLGCVIIAAIVALGMKDGKLDDSLTKFMGGFGAFMTAVIYGVLSSNGNTPPKQEEIEENHEDGDGDE